MIELVGLDLDGTLIDSAPDLSDALGQALAALGLPAPTEAQTRSWIGDGIETLIQRGIAHYSIAAATADNSRAALAAFDAYYRRNYFARSELYPGVVPTLERLRESGVRTVCITNKRIAFARPLLEAAGLHELLDATFGGDSFANKKPAPDALLAASRQFATHPTAALMVGDSPNDMDAAAAAGWRFCFAAYGYTDAMRARGVEPGVRIDEFAGLEAFLGGPG